MSLSSEVWALICSHLDSLEQLHNLALVNKQFSHLIASLKEKQAYWTKLARQQPLPGCLAVELYFASGTYPQEGGSWDWNKKQLWHLISRDLYRDGEEEEEDQDCSESEEESAEIREWETCWHEHRTPSMREL